MKSEKRQYQNRYYGFKIEIKKQTMYKHIDWLIDWF